MLILTYGCKTDITVIKFGVSILYPWIQVTFQWIKCSKNHVVWFLRLGQNYLVLSGCLFWKKPATMYEVWPLKNHHPGEVTVLDKPCTRTSADRIYPCHRIWVKLSIQSISLPAEHLWLNSVIAPRSKRISQPRLAWISLESVAIIKWLLFYARKQQRLNRILPNTLLENWGSWNPEKSANLSLILPWKQ